MRAGPWSLGQAHEQRLGAAGARKADGVYYTGPAVARLLVRATLGRLCARLDLPDLQRVRVLDPACGAGAFLLAAHEALAAALLRRYAAAPRLHRDRLVTGPDGRLVLSAAERARIVTDNLCGVDRDAEALAIARRALVLAAGAPLPALARALRCADALAMPWAGERFDAVLGDPPWGQKAIVCPPARRLALAARFPSARGIFDWFRPFVELGVELTAPGGWFGMVLPDIVLLKNYEPTRRFLLAELALTRIDWLGLAFADAAIDAVTIAGRRAPASRAHRVAVRVHDPARPVAHAVPQRDFAANPRATFNLFLTPARRAIVEALRRPPRLGDCFEVHEGIHSGNVRAELFVAARVNDSCRELLVGQGELAPYRLRWAGGHVRLAARPARGGARYANLGRAAWHEQPKLLVRRTGDVVMAAVDEVGRHASNNFFLVFPAPGVAYPLGLHGLCALLNSRFVTWLFRAVEPREGRAFCELKIKHLVDFPLPDPARPGARAALRALVRLGARRATAPAARQTALDAAIDRAVLALFDLAEPLP